MKDFENSKEDFREKVVDLLDKIHASAKDKLDRYLEENSDAVNMHMENYCTYDIPKDFVVALMEDAAWGYGPLGCSPSSVRRSRKNTKKFIHKIYL